MGWGWKKATWDGDGKKEATLDGDGCHVSLIDTAAALDPFASGEERLSFVYATAIGVRGCRDEESTKSVGHEFPYPVVMLCVLSLV